MVHRLVLLVILVVPLWLSGCSNEESESLSVRAVRAEQVVYQDSSRISRYSGIIEARREAELSFGTYGRVLVRSVGVGDRFKAGDLLIEIDATDNRKKLSGASARLTAARSELVNATAELKRHENLLAGRHVSQAAYDRQLNLHRIADANVVSLISEVELAEIVIQKSRLMALADGVVTDLYVELGQELAPLQAAIRVAYNGVTEVLIDLPERALELASVGEQVEVSYWALPGVVSVGVIREIAPKAERGSGTYPIRISLPDTDPRVRMGMTAEVTLSVKRAVPVAVLPLTALHSTAEGEPALWIVDAESQLVQLVLVEVESLEQDQVNIISGVEEGAWVVTAGVQKLRNGEQVRLL